MSDLAVTQIATIKALVDTLADLGISPLHLLTNARKMSDTRPDISLWTQRRTDFEALCAHLKAKPVERMAHQPGQREWYAEHDTDERRLLIQCVSFPHHDDWQPREAS
jgi:hypothetical protein